MIKGFKKRAGCLLSALVLALTVLPACADPLVYLVSGPGESVLYLMGTLHVGMETDGLPDTAEKALETCGVLALEVDPGKMRETDIAYLQQAARLFLPAGIKLSDLVGPELTQRCAAALGMDRNLLERFVPYGAVSLLNEMDYAALSLDPDRGADRMLYALALQKGIRVTGLETVKAQMDVLLELDTAYCVAELEEELADPEGVRAEIRTLYTLWRAGDEKGLEALFAMEAETADPASAEAYALLVTDRNRGFAQSALALLEGGERAFMAVGCGHLYGGEGLLKLLEKAGCRVERLESFREVP